MNTFARQLGAGVRALLILTLVLGLAYTAVLLGVGRVIASDQAGGSLIFRADRPIGSSLLGQEFGSAQSPDPQWFHGRPSVSGYAGDASGGSNFGPNAAAQRSAVAQRHAALVRANPGADPHAIPPDALTASASGLDPHISPAYAKWQVVRVAAARQLSEAVVIALVDQHTQGRTLGFLGAPRVNVLELNLALEALATSSSR